jgi:hypothetical protein
MLDNWVNESIEIDHKILFFRYFCDYELPSLLEIIKKESQDLEGKIRGLLFERGVH